MFKIFKKLFYLTENKSNRGLRWRHSLKENNMQMHGNLSWVKPGYLVKWLWQYSFVSIPDGCVILFLFENYLISNFILRDRRIKKKKITSHIKNSATKKTKNIKKIKSPWIRQFLHGRTLKSELYFFGVEFF